MSLFRNKKTLKAVRKVAEPFKVQNIDHIKKWEGLRLNAYLPTPNDKWTIGYGHTKTAYKGMVITEARAEELLRGDIAWVEAAIHKLVKVKLTQNQFDALAGLIYNIGEGAFSRSTVLKKINAGDYQGAADAFMMWTKQRNRKTGQMETLQGLVNRREDERRLFLK